MPGLLASTCGLQILTCFETSDEETAHPGLICTPSRNQTEGSVVTLFSGRGLHHNKI